VKTIENLRFIDDALKGLKEVLKKIVVVALMVSYLMILSF